MKPDPPISLHAFLFPFTLPDLDDADLLKTIEGKLHPAWQRQASPPNASLTRYNQHLYFHDFAEPALFGSASDSTLSRYEYAQLGAEARFELAVRWKEKKKLERKTYSLHLDSLTLSLYETGVGILSFQLHTTDPTLTWEDICRINDRGRRLFPAFLEDSEGTYLDSTRLALLADSVRISNASGLLSSEEFKEYETSLPYPIRLAQHIPAFLFREECQNQALRPLIDDRMYAACYWRNDDFSSNLKPSDPEPYLCNKAWYQLLFVDGNGLTCENEEMMRELLATHSYPRWVNSGTLTGASRYSLLCVSEAGDLSEPAPFSDKLLADFQHLYLPMAQLCLAQRASVLQFSARVARLSNGKFGAFAEQEINQVGRLSWDYIRFINRQYFREVTPQEQGIELYDLMQKVMRIEKEVSDLGREINELNQFAELQLQRTRTDEQTKLSRIATLFLPASLVAAMLAWVSDKPWFVEGWPVDWRVVKMAAVFTLLVILALLSAPPITKRLVNLFFKNNPRT